MFRSRRSGWIDLLYSGLQAKIGGDPRDVCAGPARAGDIVPDYRPAEDKDSGHRSPLPRQRYHTSLQFGSCESVSPWRHGSSRVTTASRGNLSVSLREPVCFYFYGPQLSQSDRIYGPGPDPDTVRNNSPRRKVS